MTTKNYKTIIDQSWQLRREKKFRDAELILNEAMAEHSVNSFEHKLLKANLADVLLRQGNAQEARDTALEIIEADPRQVTALTVLGLAALELKAPEEAAENLQKAYNLAPNSFRAGRLARALELSGNPDKALATLREAIQKHPNDHYLIKQFGAMEEKAASISELPRVLPGEVDEEDFLLYAEKMKAKLKSLNPADAAEQLKKIIKIGKRKKNPHLHLLLGDLLRKAENEEEALEAYIKAREIDPHNLLALSQLLYTYRRLGRTEEAWPLLKLLLYHRPTDKTAKSSLLKDAVDLGKETETALYFEELLQKYPERKDFYGAIRKLKQATESAKKEQD